MPLLDLAQIFLSDLGQFVERRGTGGGVIETHCPDCILEGNKEFFLG